MESQLFDLHQMLDTFSNFDDTKKALVSALSAWEGRSVVHYLIISDHRLANEVFYV